MTKDNSSNFDWEEFESAVSFLKSEVGKMKWRDVIKAATGKRVLAFNDETLEAINILDSWIKENFKLLQEVGLTYEGRVNEFGDFMESKVKENFKHKDLEFLPTINTDGKAQSSGYPDYKINYKNNTIYGDCKVISTETKTSSFRSFYYQPTKKGKVLEDAPHFLLIFEREQKTTTAGKNDNSYPFKIIDHKIVDLYDFIIGFKAEFQANNKETFNLRELSKKN